MDLQLAASMAKKEHIVNVNQWHHDLTFIKYEENPHYKKLYIFNKVI